MSGDMFFGLNLPKLSKLGTNNGPPPVTPAPVPTKPLMNPLPTDTFTFSGNVLSNAAPQILQVAGIPIKLDASTLHTSTLTTLKNPPEHFSQFPPLTDVND